MPDTPASDTADTTPETKDATTDDSGVLVDALPEPETGGRKKGGEPSRYQTWEKNGRDIDF